MPTSIACEIAGVTSATEGSTVNDSNLPKHSWLSIGVVGGLTAVAAGLIGFLDYFVPSTTQNLCIDVEEGISDLYVAGLALFGGILAIYGRVKPD